MNKKYIDIFENGQISVIPYPQNVRFKNSGNHEEGNRIIKPKKILIGKGIGNNAAEVFTEWIRKTGILCSINVSDESSGGKEELLIEGTQVNNMDAEAYEIKINGNCISVASGGKSGELYALATLYQMIVSDQLMECEIQDCPKYGYRGFSLDVSRHFFDKNEILRLLDQAALLKMNKFHFHVSDDRGYRLPSKKYRELNRIGSCRKEKDGTIYNAFYSEDEIREIVQYADARGITVIPEIDIPGHSLALIASYPELSCEGIQREVSIAGGIEHQIMCGGSDETRKFLKNLLDEVCDLFPGGPIHLGGDEAPKDKWDACPKCQKRIQIKGLKNSEELQADLLNEMSAYLEEKGREVICWNEAAGSGKLNKNIIVQYWDELHPSAMMQQEALNGRKFIFSNVQSMYADYGYGLEPLKACYEAEPSITGQKNFKDDQDLGFEVTMWTEAIQTNEELEYMLFPRLAAASEAAWLKNRDYDMFLKRLPVYLEMTELFEINSCSSFESFSEEEFAERVISDACRIGMIDPAAMSKEEMSRNIVGWTKYLMGAFIPPAVSEMAVKQVSDQMSGSSD